MSDHRLPTVRVVVLNWNSAWFTSRCLRALERTDYPADRLQVVLVDNGSVDGSLEQLRRSFPDQRIIASGQNLGFAEGCNRGMRDRDGVDHVALVNNDAVVEPGWLRPLVDVLESDPTVGAASARLVLEPEFVAVDVDAEGPVTLVGASVDGLEVTGAVRYRGWRVVPALDWPLDITHVLDGAIGRLWLPAGPDACRVELHLAGRGRVTVRAGDESVVGCVPTRVTLAPGRGRVALLNGIGTSLNDRCEGFDLHYGEVDGGEVDGGEVDGGEVLGFCGGGALLRSRMLDQVGLFDPGMFAYYEDTDLSWRARRAGWRVVGVPDSVIHHAFGASAGTRARGFFYLDRRNWWLTAERNATPDQRAVVRATVRASVGRAVRANVFGRLRRGKRPRIALVGAWVRVCLDVAIERRRRSRHRETGQIGVRPTDRVLGRFQPRPAPRPPAPRPGGPLVVHIDVTDTLRSGWWAGIQRVVRALVIHLPDAAPDLEVVPVVYVPERSAFRRVNSAEYRRLLEPAPDGRAVHDDRGVHRPVRRTAVGALDRFGAGDVARRARRRWSGSRSRSGSDRGDVITVDPLAPGSVLLDLDAVWNQADPDRSSLLAELCSTGVRVVVFVHDLVPLERPEWFVPELVEDFGRTVRAQIRHADLVLTSSETNAHAVSALAGESGRSDLGVCVVPLGGDRLEPTAPDADTDALPGELAKVPFLLVVGTIEPRKNQTLALDAFEQVMTEDDELHLVVVGRTGWHADDIVARLRAAERAGRVHWFDAIGDAAVDALYRAAFLVLVPSLTEGYGLAVVEAIVRGSAVISSPGGGLAEAGRDVAEYVDVGDPGAWADRILRHRRDAVWHATAVGRSRDARPVTWAESARRLAEELRTGLDVKLRTGDVDDTGTAGRPV